VPGVMDADKLSGIISERDYARKIVLKGKASRDTLVKDIMTEQVIKLRPAIISISAWSYVRKTYPALPIIESGK